MEKSGYRKRLQASIDFIEENVREDLALKDVSFKANASLYHFHRLFRAFVGQSVAEYIRGRRLTHAARDLVRTRKPVIDIAFDYRYSTPESFLRAFKALYGTTPRDFRKKGLFRPAHRKADLINGAAAAQRGGTHMEPRIVDKEPSALFGSLIHTRHGTCHGEVTAFWERARREGTIGKMVRKAGVPYVFGACFGTCEGCGAAMEGDSARFAYVIGWEASKGDRLPDGMVEMALPGGTYAVFALEGGEREMQDAISRIYGSWLPESSWELADTPVLEKYGSEWTGGRESSMELWLPVRKGRE
jgi:AraC family transcriptional regulator